MSFYEGTYHDLIQETLLKCLISSIFLAEHTLLRVYPKFPQIVYRSTYLHTCYHHDMLEASPFSRTERRNIKDYKEKPKYN